MTRKQNGDDVDAEFVDCLLEHCVAILDLKELYP